MDEEFSFDDLLGISIKKEEEKKDKLPVEKKVEKKIEEIKEEELEECDFCGKMYKNIARHLRRCKVNPANFQIPKIVERFKPEFNITEFEKQTFLKALESMKKSMKKRFTSANADGKQGQWELFVNFIEKYIIPLFGDLNEEK